jgi:hypothetical protein
MKKEKNTNILYLGWRVNVFNFSIQMRKKRLINEVPIPIRCIVINHRFTTIIKFALSQQPIIMPKIDGVTSSHNPRNIIIKQMEIVSCTLPNV